MAEDRFRIEHMLKQTWPGDRVVSTVAIYPGNGTVIFETAYFRADGEVDEWRWESREAAVAGHATLAAAIEAGQEPIAHKTKTRKIRF